jgi:hypothetical protein
MALQVKNVARLSAAERDAVAQRAEAIRRGHVGIPSGKPARSDVPTLF